MLILALVASLTASMPDTVTRLPGTRLRMGMAEAMVLERGTFAEVKATGGLTARQGDARFFGVPCQATYYFRDGRLARARFQATGVSPRAQDYVEDQLRRSGFRRTCAHDERRDRQCEWLAASLQVRLLIQDDRLDSVIEAWPPPRDAEPPARPPEKPEGTERAAAGSGMADSLQDDTTQVATLPETLAISLVSRNSASDWPRIVSSLAMDLPEAADRAGAQGVVWVLALVGADGRVRRATVEGGASELDEPAISWVSRARFAPCERNGQPCRFHVRVAVRFALP